MLTPEPKTPMRGRYSHWFLLVTSIFITCLITSNIIAVKLVNIFGLILPAAILIFPISYIFGDVLTEVYGYRQARQVIWLGFFCNLIAVVAIWLGQILPAASFWDGQAAYERILGYTPRLLGASFLAYLVGEFANSFVLAKMKIATNGRWLWARTIGSTLVGQGLDSLVFMTLAIYRDDSSNRSRRCHRGSVALQISLRSHYYPIDLCTGKLPQEKGRIGCL
jgi:queuosine precursor transporter